MKYGHAGHVGVLGGITDHIIGPHFYGQPADDIFSVIFLVGHSMDLSAVSDCAVYVDV